MALNAEVVGVCVSLMCGSERVEVTGTLLSSPFADIFVDVASESQEIATIHEKSPGVRKVHIGFFFSPSGAQQGSNLQSSVFHMQSSAIRLEIEEMGRSDMGN